MVAVGGAVAQRADTTEAAGPVGGVAVGAIEAVRFLIFNTPGRLVHHARKVMLRFAISLEQLAEWIAAWKLLHVAT